MRQQAQECLMALGGHNVAGHGPFVACTRIKRGVAIPGIRARIIGHQARRHTPGGKCIGLCTARDVFHPTGIRLGFVCWLDADDLSAPLGQELGDMRSGPDYGDFGNAQSGERQPERRVLACLYASVR